MNTSELAPDSEHSHVASMHTIRKSKLQCLVHNVANIVWKFVAISTSEGGKRRERGREVEMEKRKRRRRCVYVCVCVSGGEGRK